MGYSKTDELAINTIRTLAVSKHPALPRDWWHLPRYRHISSQRHHNEVCCKRLKLNC
jgi:hypothetical protein